MTMYAVHDVPAIKKLTTQDRDGGTFWPTYQLFFLGQHCLRKGTPKIDEKIVSTKGAPGLPNGSQNEPKIDRSC